MQPLRYSLGLVCLSLALSFVATGPIRADDLQTRIAGLTAEVLSGRVEAIGGIRLTSPGFITQIYTLRDNAPIWTDDAQRTELFRELTDAERHGFRPEDFKLDRLFDLHEAAAAGDTAALAEFDVAGTEVVARLLHHIYYGKVDPKSLNADWTFERAFPPGDPAKFVNEYLDAASLSALIDDIEIRHPVYLRLQEALERYQALAAAGGWRAVPGDAVLREGDEGPLVSALKQRLATTGDLPELLNDGAAFDEGLADAVRRFQTRHGLEADAVVGPRTFRALNRTVDERIDQLRASLERARWLLRDLEDDFVIVNIGGPETYLVQDGKLVWRARSIVGQAYRQTPVFRDNIQYMEFNPTWTVPVSIFRRDKLPRIRRDRGYLARGNYTVLNSAGRPIHPNSVNWNGTPRVTLRQEPGPKNALGMVKFMFPNVHAVYLHDTDNRSLFARNERNLSSGCVRVENPFELADLLMKNDPDWSVERREAILASGRTTRVNLPTPIPVLLTYFTAWMNNEGVIHFREDIYERDPKVLSSLNAAFTR